MQAVNKVKLMELIYDKLCDNTEREQFGADMADDVYIRYDGTGAPIIVIEFEDMEYELSAKFKDMEY